MKIIAAFLIFLACLLLTPQVALAQSEAGNQVYTFIQSAPGASSIYIKLPDSKIVEKNSEGKQPAFSTIKLWIAGTVMQSVQNGSLNLTSSYTVKAADKVGGTGFISIGSTYTYEQLLEYMLTHSDNSASNILIDSVGGLGAVNSFISSSGYGNTSINRYLAKSGPENLTTAKDAATFMENLYQKKVVSFQSSEKILSILEKRTAIKKDGLYLSRSLTALSQFIGKSGVGPNTRNDAGSFLNQGGGRVFVGVFLANLPNEAAGESFIGQLGQLIYGQTITGGDIQPPVSSTSASLTNISKWCTKVGSPVGPSPCQTVITISSEALGDVLNWASQITNSLARALWGFLNNLATAITNGSYSTKTWSGASEGAVYWCTYLIIDSYNLAGHQGLSKANHAAVIYMRKWWYTTGAGQGYVYIDYPSNNQLLQNVKPGYAMFMEQEAGVFKQREHVNMIKSITVDSRGNGEIITLDSNTPIISHKYSIVEWSIKGIPYPVRGFGGM